MPWWAALLCTLALVVALAAWTARLTPPTFTAGGGPAASYWLTQPFVSLRYAAAFFLPIDLSADLDWQLVDGFLDIRVLAGVAFAAVSLEHAGER